MRMCFNSIGIDIKHFETRSSSFTWKCLWWVSLWRIHELVPAPSTVVLIGCPATIPILIGQEESNRVEKMLIRHTDTLVEAPFFYKWVLALKRAQKTLLQQAAAGSIRQRSVVFLWFYGSWQPGHPLFWCSLACEATGQSWRLQQLCPENWDKFRHPEKVAVEHLFGQLGETVISGVSV